MATQDELYTKFSTGKKPNGDDFKALIDFRGASVKSIALTTTEGKVTGGTATLTDNSTVAITVTEG